MLTAKRLYKQHLGDKNDNQDSIKEEFVNRSNQEKGSNL
jgi:hypothetical protein